MTARDLIQRIVLQEDLNFLLTNRVPRRLLTRFMGWFSRIENPVVSRLSIGAWRLFTDLDLSEAKELDFRSLHACFTRELRPGARPIDADPAVLVSPCDGLVGECGTFRGTELLQAKGFPYRLEDLLGSTDAIERFRDGTYVTIRLTSAMYHRFHAPADATVRRVTYYSGDTWNVNPIALARVERLFCKNERAAIEMTLADGGAPLLLVPVAAILVASIRLHALDVRLHLRYRGPNVIDCEAAYRRGDEMGWFEHGSTILVFAPPGYSLAGDVGPGRRLRMGEALLRRGVRA